MERYLSDVTRGLRGAGFHIDLLHAEGASTTGVFDSTFALPGLWRAGAWKKPATMDQLKDVLASGRPDVVYAHDIENGAALTWLAERVPVVRYVHGFKTTCPDGKRLLNHPEDSCLFPVSVRCLARAHSRRCMPRSPFKALSALGRSRSSLTATSSLHHVVVASRFMKQVLVLNRVPEEFIAVLPYFCSWKEQGLREPLKPRGLLFVGRLVRGKGVLGLVDMVTRMDPEVTLDIVGEGPARQEVEARVAAAGLEDRVAVHGWLDGEALRQRFQINAVVVVPSLWPEPFGIVGIEAGAMSRPVVGFDVGGIGDWLVDGATGFLVRPRDFEHMRNRIESLLEHPDEARRMGLAGERLVRERYSEKNHLGVLTGILRKARASFHAKPHPAA